MKWTKFFTFIITTCLMQIASGQNTDKMITITGKVLNMDHKPVEEAVFYIDNVRTIFKSKINGSYKIKVSPSALNIEVRSPEYESSKTLINNQTTINFTLKLIADSLASMPGNKIIEKRVPDSAKKTDKLKAKKINTYTDIYQMIRGEVSEVVVSGRSILVQQGHSFFGSSDPLFVVNGAIVESIDYINPVEVKSITVLKGSSAAIYGVRGSNGVICITLINGAEKEK
jgi:TonB-dependent starch-binding outer membrane protein SusC